ncbi:MAG TPA: NAD(P)-dependent oxidoreductase [Deltaproteobacteria bacterium]|nr:NAD(P)-dependent oxidoreductase [Deltaproteobacteria bacterium]
MATIAVLGTGLLGSGFVENLIGKGHRVQIYNRTADKCAPLVALGAIASDEPAGAVRGAERVHLVLSEDPAVDEVIAAMRPGLGEGVPILDHSTNSPARVAARYELLRGEGVHYLHAPVFMAPANARAATGLMLISGPSDEVAALRPALEGMTGRLHHVGERPDKAAAIKLVGNGMLVMLSGVMGDLFRLGQANDLSPEEILELFGIFSPTPAGIGQRVLAAGTRPASFELTMARKDVRLMIEAAGGPGALTVLPVVAGALDRALEAGHGSEDYAVFAKPPGQSGS